MASANHHGGVWCSALEKAVRLLKQQRELQAELATLSAQAGNLDEDEKQQLQELLDAAQPPALPEAAAQPPLQALLQEVLASGLSKGSDLDKLQSVLSQLQVSDPLGVDADDAGRVEMPKEVRDFLAEAGVLDAVPWDGRPAQPSYGAFPPPPGGWPGQDADDIAADAKASVEDVYDDDDEQISGVCWLSDYQ